MLLAIFILLILYGICVGLYLSRAFVRGDFTFKTISKWVLIHLAVNIFLLLCYQFGWIPDARHKGYGLQTLNMVFLLAMLCGAARTIATALFIYVLALLRKWIKR